MKIFKKSVWVMLSIFFALLFIVAVVGSDIMNDNQAAINGVLGITTSETIDLGDDGVDKEYYKSDFVKADGSYDDEAMRANSEQVALQTAVEGSVLLWNENNTLPLKPETKVNLFGVSTMVDNWSIPSRHFLIQGEGSGMMYDQNAGIIRRSDLAAELEEKGLTVNKELVSKYNKIGGTYRKGLTRNSDFSYKFSLNEAPWSAISDTVNSSVDGGVAVMIISRNGGEYKDIRVGEQFVGNTHLDEYNYLDLSVEEADVLENLNKLKQDGKISGIVLLINAANPVQFKNLTAEKYGIDSCAFIGMGGTQSFVQIAEVLTAQSEDMALSGHLMDTFVYSARSAPAFENYGDFTWSEYSDKLPDLANEGTGENVTHNTKYMVYQEGIYVGYKYYETRYEDYVLGNGNAGSAKGATSGNAWNYGSEVAFPFGYGLSYTTFERSEPAFTEKEDVSGWDISMDIRNSGSDYSGKDVLQVYLQKPYTEYDKQNRIEKSAVELVGFAKTDLLEVGSDAQTLTVSVDKEALRTYDAYGAKTYILEEGDYYLAVGTDAHDALNNILAAKGNTPENTDGRMDAAGNADCVLKITVNEDDFEIFSETEDGSKITNRFDNADVNIYEGTQDQKITYLSRSDWEGTYPAEGGVQLKCTNETMVADMQYGADYETDPEAEIPAYGKDNGLTLIMLKGKDYNDPMWDDLLDQTTLAEQQWLCSYGLKYMASVESIAVPEMLAHDGPVGLKTANPALGTQMCFPSPVNMACTWDTELIEKLGDAFGHEMLHAGYTVIYAPGANIHRTAYGGRNWEYYSEDGFLSGKMLSAEVQGLQSRGAIVVTKHFALNDQETNRYGVSIWANEQAIRETYLSAFEIAIREGGMNGVMSSFNRIGCTWAGAHKGLLTDILSDEWNFTGIVETDACAGGVAHMTSSAAKAAGLVAGNNLWMDSGNENYFGDYKNDATVMQALREASKRILFNQLYSNGMNGIGSNTIVINHMAWWQKALIAAQATVGTLMGIMIVMAVLSFVFDTRKFRAWYGEKQAVAAAAKAERVTAIAAAGQAAGSGYYIGGGAVGGLREGYYVDGERQRVSTKKRDVLILTGAIIAAVAVTLCATLPFLIGRGTDTVGGNPVCPVCGGLLSSGDGTVCGEGKTAYEFNAADAEKVAGTQLPQDFVSKKGTAYVGGLENNVGAGLTFNVYAESSTTATLVVSINRLTVDTVFTDMMQVEVNGNKFSSEATVAASASTEDYNINFVDVTLGCVELQEGNNVIELTTANALSYNFSMLKLKCDEPLRETYSTYTFGAGEFAMAGAGKLGMPKIENTGFVGNLSGNANATLTFKLVAEKDCTVTLSAAVTGRRQDARKFTAGFVPTVNGVEVVSDAIVPQGEQSTEWTVSYRVTIGEIHLKAGENTLTFTVPESAANTTDASNFDYISIMSMFGVTCTSSWLS